MDSPAFLVMRTIAVRECQACYSAYEPATDDHRCLYERRDRRWGEIGTDGRTGEAFAQAIERAHEIIIAAFPEATAGRKVGVRIWCALPDLVDLAARREALEQELVALETRILAYGAERELTSDRVPRRD